MSVVHNYTWLYQILSWHIQSYTRLDMKHMYFLSLKSLMLICQIPTVMSTQMLKSWNIVKGALAEWSRHPSSTSQVSSSIPYGNKFLDWVKKNPLASPHAKTQVKALPICGYGTWRRPGTHMGLCGPCVRVGEGFGVFSACIRSS
jgi:hypothetical protein